jgi:type I restriction enzyme S subunit
MKLKEIGRVVTGKTPPTSNPEFYGGEYMFITPNELHENYIVRNSEKKITELGMQSIASNTISGTSVMVGCIGWDMGNVAICTEKCATNQQINSITDISEDYNPYYLYYWLKGKKDYLFSIASVTRTPILSKSTFEEIEVPVVNRTIQDKIVRVLQAIDKKISINEMVNDTLQNMAHELFMHQYFKKPANGKIGDILIEHDKSSIQVGDAKCSIGDTPFFTSGNSVLRWPEPIIDGRNCYINTGGNAGVKFYVGEAAYSTDTWCISGKGELSDYLFLFLKSVEPELNQKFFQGTGLKHLQKPLLKDRPIYIPSHPETEKFNRTVQPWLSMVSENIRESQKLSQIREWLLPMLMNGQATVED